MTELQALEAREAELKKEQERIEAERKKLAEQEVELKKQRTEEALQARATLLVNTISEKVLTEYSKQGCSITWQDSARCPNQYSLKVFFPDNQKQLQAAWQGINLKVQRSRVKGYNWHYKESNELELERVMTDPYTGRRSTIKFGKTKNGINVDKCMQGVFDNVTSELQKIKREQEEQRKRNFLTDFIEQELPDVASALQLYRYENGTYRIECRGVPDMALADVQAINSILLKYTKSKKQEKAEREAEREKWALERMQWVEEQEAAAKQAEQSATPQEPATDQQLKDML